MLRIMGERRHGFGSESSQGTLRIDPIGYHCHIKTVCVNGMQTIDSVFTSYKIECITTHLHFFCYVLDLTR